MSWRRRLITLAATVVLAALLVTCDNRRDGRPLAATATRRGAGAIAAGTVAALAGVAVIELIAGRRRRGGHEPPAV